MTLSTKQRELRKLADSWRRARERERERAAELYAAIHEASHEMSEADIVRTTGINRVTVRKAMGKDQHQRPLSHVERHLKDVSV